MCLSQRFFFAALVMAACAQGACLPAAAQPGAVLAPAYTVQPVGWVRKAGSRTYIEIEPRYVQVALERWERFTGGKALQITEADEA